MHIQPPKKKNKHKHKQSRTQDPVPPGKGCCRGRPAPPLQHRQSIGSSGASAPPETPSDSDHKKKKKKKEEDPERKRKKKEKKKKKVSGKAGAQWPARVPLLCEWLSPRGCCPAVLTGSVCPCSAEPAQPRAPRGGQLPGQQQLTVTPCQGTAPAEPRDTGAGLSPWLRGHPCSPPSTRGTDSVGADLGFLYLNNVEHPSLFFSHLLIKACSEEGLVAVAAVTLGCHRAAQTKVSLERVGVPSFGS